MAPAHTIVSTHTIACTLNPEHMSHMYGSTRATRPFKVASVQGHKVTHGRAHCALSLSHLQGVARARRTRKVWIARATHHNHPAAGEASPSRVWHTSVPVLRAAVRASRPRPGHRTANLPVAPATTKKQCRAGSQRGQPVCTGTAPARTHIQPDTLLPRAGQGPPLLCATSCSSEERHTTQQREWTGYNPGSCVCGRGSAGTPQQTQTHTHTPQYAPKPTLCPCRAACVWQQATARSRQSNANRQERHRRSSHAAHTRLVYESHCQSLQPSRTRSAAHLVCCAVLRPDRE